MLKYFEQGIKHAHEEIDYRLKCFEKDALELRQELAEDNLSSRARDIVLEMNLIVVRNMESLAVLRHNEHMKRKYNEEMLNLK